MFCYVVKIVYIFITIFLLSPFSIGQKGHAFLRHASWWAPHAGQRTMKWPCPLLYAHTRTGLCWAGKYALLWHTNGRGRTAGATRTSVYFGILLYTPQLPSPIVVLAVVSCCLPLWLLMLFPAWSAVGCAPAHSTQPGDKSQPTWTIFSFGPSFCALMIIGLISFFHRSHCSPGPLGMHRMLALFVFSPSHSITFSLGVKSFKDIENVVRYISCF